MQLESNFEAPRRVSASMVIMIYRTLSPKLLAVTSALSRISKRKALGFKGPVARGSIPVVMWSHVHH